MKQTMWSVFKLSLFVFVVYLGLSMLGLRQSEFIDVMGRMLAQVIDKR